MSYPRNTSTATPTATASAPATSNAFYGLRNGRISELLGRGYVIETSAGKDEYGFAYHRLVREPKAHPVTLGLTGKISHDLALLDAWSGRPPVRIIRTET